MLTSPLKSLDGIQQNLTPDGRSQRPLLSAVADPSKENPDLVRKHLIEDSYILIDWFKFNRMQANPEKFQAIAIGQRSAKEFDSFTLNNVNIPCENEVKLLGVTIDFKLKAILQVLIHKALYDKSYMGSKTTMTSGEWTCLISFATAPLTCSERGGSEKFKMKIYVSSGI